MNKLIPIILIILIGCMKTETIECNIIDKKVISSPQSFQNFDKQKLEHFFVCKGRENLKIDPGSFYANQAGDTFVLTEQKLTVTGYIVCIILLILAVIAFGPLILFMD